eukprot:4957149-Prymnesium_polylepis.2
MAGDTLTDADSLQVLQRARELPQHGGRVGLCIRAVHADPVEYLAAGRQLEHEDESVARLEAVEHAHDRRVEPHRRQHRQLTRRLRRTRALLVLRVRRRAKLVNELHGVRLLAQPAARAIEFGRQRAGGRATQVRTLGTGRAARWAVGERRAAEACVAPHVHFLTVANAPEPIVWPRAYLVSAHSSLGKSGARAEMFCESTATRRCSRRNLASTRTLCCIVLHDLRFSAGDERPDGPPSSLSSLRRCSSLAMSVVPRASELDDGLHWKMDLRESIDGERDIFRGITLSRRIVPLAAWLSVRTPLAPDVRLSRELSRIFRHDEPLDEVDETDEEASARAAAVAPPGGFDTPPLACRCALAAIRPSPCVDGPSSSSSGMKAMSSAAAAAGSGLAGGDGGAGAASI